MPVKVRVKLRQGALDEVNRILKSLSPKQNRAINKRALTRAALEVQRLASSKYIVRGRGKDAPPLPDRLTSRRGGSGLAGSIGTDILKDAARIGTDLIYGAVHEFGKTPRPFLQPALEEASKKFDRIYADVLNSELRSA